MFMVWLIFLVIISIFLLAFSVSIIETQSVNVIERFGKFVRIQKAVLTLEYLLSRE